MPNGFHGSTKEWGRMEAPLRAIDAILQAFAERHRMELTRNYHNWPERSLTWDAAPRRSIQIWLADEQDLCFAMAICAWEDRTRGRFWKNRIMIASQSLDELRPRLLQLLENAKAEVDGWTSNDLVAAQRRR